MILSWAAALLTGNIARCRLTAIYIEDVISACSEKWSHTSVYHHTNTWSTIVHLLEDNQVPSYVYTLITRSFPLVAHDRTGERYDGQHCHSTC